MRIYALQEMLFSEVELNTFCSTNGRCLFPNHGNYIICTVECILECNCWGYQIFTATTVGANGSLAMVGIYSGQAVGYQVMLLV